MFSEHVFSLLWFCSQLQGFYYLFQGITPCFRTNIQYRHINATIFIWLLDLVYLCKSCWMAPYLNQPYISAIRWAFPFQSNCKNLDPSGKMDLDFEDCFERVPCRTSTMTRPNTSNTYLRSPHPHPTPTITSCNKFFSFQFMYSIFITGRIASTSRKQCMVCPIREVP